MATMIETPAKPVAEKTTGVKLPTKMVAVARTIAGRNDRTVFDPAAITELAESIREQGLIQPITVRPFGDGFEVVAGERRFRAIQEIGWSHFPGIVKEMTDEEAAGVMLTENTSRANLDPIDEARAYERRMTDFSWTCEQVAKKAGVSGARVRARLKLLKLEPTLQMITRTGQFPLGYAQILVDAELDEAAQVTAMRLFNQQARPTLDWFREVVVKLLACKQVSMLEEFELEMTVQQAGGEQIPDKKRLPRPAKNAAPVIGVSVREVLENQRMHWADASKNWNGVNSPFIAYEADAAAAVLSHLLGFLPAHVLNADAVEAEAEVEAEIGTEAETEAETPEVEEDAPTE